MTFRFLLFAILVLSPPLRAETVLVGPEQPLRRIADAARIARDGDTVIIFPGEYRGDVAIWNQKHLTIRGLDPRPVLIAEGKHAEGKAIWVIRDGHIRVDNIEFRGARVPDGNGAGIRFEKGRLEVHNAVFDDNQNGILTANFPDAELIIRNSIFANAPQNTSLPHLLYVGRIARVEITGSHFHHGRDGHLIKSRARKTDLRYNLIHDGENGSASYEVNLPNGGHATLIGNTIGQSASTSNPVVIAYGEEGNLWPENHLTLAHNTLLNAQWPGAWFLRIPLEKFATPPDVLAVNNLTVGPGVFSLAAIGRFYGNYPALLSSFVAPEMLDFRLTGSSWLRGIARTPAPDDRTRIPAPVAEFSPPAGTRPVPPARPVSPGAYQSTP